MKSNIEIDQKSGFCFGVVNATGEILARGSIKTKKNGAVDYDTVEEYLSALTPKLNEMIDSLKDRYKFKGIGMGAPNANYYTGCIEDSPNIKWGKGRVVPIAQLLTEATGLKCKITNDANAAAIGEMQYGVAKGMKDFIMITLGTGVGSGIVAGGNLIYGADGNAGELGHTTSVRHNGRLCGCGGSGHLETYASATGVARSAREFLEARKGEASLLREINGDIESKDVYDAAVKGDKIAIDVFEFTGKILGEAFADFVAFSRPQAIILFGGLAKSGDVLMKPLKENMEKNLMPIFRNKIEVLLSGLKESDAAILGASALAWEA